MGTVLSQFLTSLYSWYEEAAETPVHLANVLSSSDDGWLVLVTGTSYVEDYLIL